MTATRSCCGFTAPAITRWQAIRSELAWMAALRRADRCGDTATDSGADGSEVVTVVRDDHPLNVDAVTFIAGCTAEEMPDAVGFDQLGRITAAMHDHVRSWGAPDVLHPVLLGRRDHDRAARRAGATGGMRRR